MVMRWSCNDFDNDSGNDDGDWFVVSGPSFPVGLRIGLCQTWEFCAIGLAG